MKYKFYYRNTTRTETIYYVDSNDFLEESNNIIIARKRKQVLSLIATRRKVHNNGTNPQHILWNKERIYISEFELVQDESTTQMLNAFMESYGIDTKDS